MNSGVLVVCGVRLAVEGTGNVPVEPGVLVSKSPDPRRDGWEMTGVKLVLPMIIRLPY